jgi:hypothetical protein
MCLDKQLTSHWFNGDKAGRGRQKHAGGGANAGSNDGSGQVLPHIRDKKRAGVLPVGFS